MKHITRYWLKRCKVIAACCFINALSAVMLFQMILNRVSFLSVLVVICFTIFWALIMELFPSSFEERAHARELDEHHKALIKKNM